MSDDFSVTLGPRALGAHVLVHIAHHRLTGVLSWGFPTRTVQFNEGRPSDANSVRTFATQMTGRCTFRVTQAEGAPSDVDTLGEVLLAIHTLTPVQLDTYFALHGRYKVEKTSTFERLSQVIEQVSGARISAPAAVTLETLISSSDAKERRAWAAMMILGGLKSAAPPLTLQAYGDDNPLTRDIENVYAKQRNQDHYGYFEIDRKASVEEIRKAYFEAAKRWHPDRFINVDLGDARKLVEDLFRRAEQAHRLLTDEKERKSYDWMLDRQAQGLPTDPKMIMEAENLFRKGEGLLRRGQAAAALPLFEKAVQLNKGEAEFWAFLGFALYQTRGKPFVSRAEEALAKAIEMRPKIDTAYEFLGRIEHAEGRISDAKKHLQRALELNPKNKEATRELRLLEMREGQHKGLGTRKILGKILKK